MQNAVRGRLHVHQCPGSRVARQTARRRQLPLELRSKFLATSATTGCGEQGGGGEMRNHGMLRPSTAPGGQHMQDVLSLIHGPSNPVNDGSWARPSSSSSSAVGSRGQFVGKGTSSRRRKKKKKKGAMDRPGTHLGNLVPDGALYGMMHAKQRKRRPQSSPINHKPRNELAIKQDIVDKLATKGDALEIKLIKLHRTAQTVREQILDEKRTRKQMGGVKAYRIVQRQTQKQISILENRLDKLNIRCSEVESGNNDLVNQINAQRMERLTFERTYKRLQRDFKAKQRDMAAMLAQSNEAYEGRQSALKKLEALALCAAEEEEEAAREFAALGNVVNEQAQMKSYVANSALKRKEKELEERLASGNLDPEEEAPLKSKLNRLSQELEKQEQTITTVKENIQSYEEAFEKLYESAGVRDMNEIVDQFVRNEDSNFALFSHVQHINREAEREEDQLRHLQDEMEKYKKELSQNEGNRERIVKDLEGRLDRYKSQVRELSQFKERNQATLEAISQATENLFFRIGCDSMQGLEGFRDPQVIHPKTVGRSTTISALNSSNEGDATTRRKSKSAGENGGNTGDSGKTLALRLGDRVEENNIMLYLGVVEQRTNEIIQLYRKLCVRHNPNFKGSERLAENGMLIPSVPRNTRQIAVRAPSCVLERPKTQRSPTYDFRRPGEDDADDDVEQPFSSEQLREMTMREQHVGLGASE